MIRGGETSLLKSTKTLTCLEKWIKPLGRIQLDLKVSNIKNSKIRKHVYIFNMIDTSSRIVYSKALYWADKSHVMEALNEGNNFFNEKGIIITNIQANNVMIFKWTNFIKDLDFNKWCLERNISQIFIPLLSPNVMDVSKDFTEVWITNHC